MSTNFYDVVVLGTELGPLLCGALLAKRGFRVLVLGHDHLPPTYRVGPHELPRAPFTFESAHSPVARRVLSELALHQLFRRRATSADPAAQIALPDHRFDLPLDDAQLTREIEREFPEVRRPIDDYHEYADRLSRELDRLIDRDLVWPPETFFERRELARASAHQSFDRHGNTRDPLGELPDGHPFRLAVRMPAAFSTAMDSDQLNSLALARVYRGWLRGAAAVDGGRAWLRQVLFEKIETYSGEVRPRVRAEAIELHRHRAAGVLLGSDERVGCSFVISGCNLSATMRLLADRAPFEAMLERLGEPQPRFLRYTLNVVMDAEAVPVGMARDVYFVVDPTRPHHGENALHLETHPPDEEGKRLVCVQALLPRGAVEDTEHYLETIRERVLGSLGKLVPFMNGHLTLVDSPHDGREAQDLASGQSLAAEEPWHRGPAHMSAVYHFPVTRTFGVCALPVRTPIKRLLLCNPQVVPGLGTEGILLAAWSAASVVTRSDRRKEWMRRGLWTKVEI